MAKISRRKRRMQKKARALAKRNLGRVIGKLVDDGPLVDMFEGQLDEWALKRAQRAEMEQHG